MPSFRRVKLDKPVGEILQEISAERQWLINFKTEYKRRVGITYEDGGGDDEDAMRWYPLPFAEAVQQEMDKYDLDDITKTW